MTLIQMKNELDLISFERSIGYGFPDLSVERDQYEEEYLPDEEDIWLSKYYHTIALWDSLDSSDFYSDIWEDGLPF